MKTASRPPARSTQSHSLSQSSRKSSKSSTTPLASPIRAAVSVGQALPPSLVPSLRSPALQQDVRTPSPNYFGLVVDATSDPRNSGVGPTDNWSPPTSSVLSFGAASPKHIPVDSNRDFKAFRRQTESDNGFTLGGNLSHTQLAPGQDSSRLHPQETCRKDNLRESQSPSPKTASRGRDVTPDRMDLDGTPMRSSTPVKRTTMSDSPGNVPSFFDLPQQSSPSSMSPIPRNNLSHLDNRHPRLSLPQNKADPPSPQSRLQNHLHHRAETLPSSLEDSPMLISPTTFKDLMGRLKPLQILLLDLRVYPQYSQSRIQDALNLCIPTTLLKRPSFNLQKLEETFTNEGEKKRFSLWQSAKCIIVYDAFSCEKKDALSAINTLKKFTSEGWKGHSYILRGGYRDFAKAYPHLIDHRSTQEVQSSKINLSLGTSPPDVAPVAGGCLMPTTKNPANPFFGNIRQNQDLIGGVGQMNVKVPDVLDAGAWNALPQWLQEAAHENDRGKKVADKFLRLELAEQERMTKALSAGVSYGDSSPDGGEIQIAGIEKGGKNRYNNIWPFEHSRVRLQGRPDAVCDYVNASHIKASRSNKRYIASQGPLPATFEDFWSVIWDQDVRVIVMLTAEKEGGQLKCHSYWGTGDFGPLKLKALSEKKVSLDRSHRRTSEGDQRESGRRRANTLTDSASSPLSADVPHAVIRKFTLSHAAHPFSPLREITQVHYSSWPDFGAPANSCQLLALVELSNKLQRPANTHILGPENDQVSHPVLVHCSAGCGRTGTFCTIDSVIDMLKRQRAELKQGVTPMDISSQNDGDYLSAGANHGWVFSQTLDLVEDTVKEFREQRLSMVQSLRQYVLCYETVLEWLAKEGGAGLPRARSGSLGDGR